MSARISEIPLKDKPLSERWRLIAEEWVEADKAANLLEETKSAFLSQKMLALGDMPVSRAEMIVKGSIEWTEFIDSMCNARKDANLLRVRRDFLEMRFRERQNADANARKERGL